MFLIKVDKDSYINIDNIVSITLDRDQGRDDMYVITRDNKDYLVDIECRPVIQRWLDVADKRAEEDIP